MMKLFKKNTEIRINQKYYLLVQDKWAKKMSALTSDLSKQSLLIYLILFIVITSSISLYNIYNGFSSKEYMKKGIRIHSGHLIMIKPSLHKKNEKLPPKSQFEHITNFSNYSDSLKELEGGTKIYDSVKNYRPGLLDSLVPIENYYKINQNITLWKRK